MTEKEVRQEYLRIARDRRAVQGNRTVKKRLVKGRKGIGKFAGLMVADIMTLVTTARGQKTTLTIPREELPQRRMSTERKCRYPDSIRHIAGSIWGMKLKPDSRPVDRPGKRQMVCLLIPTG